MFTFVLVRRHVTFKLRMVHLWTPNFASFEESTRLDQQIRMELWLICLF